MTVSSEYGPGLTGLDEEKSCAVAEAILGLFYAYLLRVDAIVKMVEELSYPN